MPNLTSLCFPPLSQDSAAELRTRQRDYRIAHLDLLLRRARSEEVTGALGERQGELEEVVDQLLGLATDEPERFVALLADWSVVFLLSRLLQEGLSDDERGERILSTLSTAIATGGWRGQDIAGWDLAVYHDATPMGLGNGPTRESPDGWQPLPLESSLEEAHEILDGAWPEAVAWTRALVPGFVDLGGPLQRATHRSASYGADSPIFLTRVEHGFQHAEDVVHELQHLRLHLFTTSDDFSCWSDYEIGYASPYRSDPRPLRGLLIGLHAFLTVADLNLRCRDRWAESEQHLYSVGKLHAMNLLSYRTLAAHGTASGAGARLMAEMAAVLVSQDRTLARWMPPDMQRAIDRCLEEHVERVAGQGVELVNGGAEYRDRRDTVARAAAEADEVQLAS